MVGVAYVTIESKNPRGSGLFTGIHTPASQWGLSRQQIGATR